MSPIRAGIARRYPRLGFLSAGMQVEGKKGGVHPSRSDTIVFHSHRAEILEVIAERYGGEVEESPTSTERRRRWVVVTEVTELPVIVPADPLDDEDELVCQNYYEAWTAAGLKRRCDGITTLLWRQDPKGKEKVGDLSDEQVPCICRAQGLEGDAACKPTVRLNLIPIEVWSEIPDIGVFTVRSTGINTNAELASDLDLLGQMLGVLGPQVPLLLQLEQVDSRHGLVPKFRLGLAQSPKKTLELASGGRGALELEATDAPAELEEPVGSYVDEPSGEGPTEPSPSDDVTEAGSRPQEDSTGSSTTEPSPASVVVGPIEVEPLEGETPASSEKERATEAQWKQIFRIADRLGQTDAWALTVFETRYGFDVRGATKQQAQDFGTYLKEFEARQPVQEKLA